jgi:hypothetical protein
LLVFVVIQFSFYFSLTTLGSKEFFFPLFFF